jgi:hypothetical protein
MTFGDHNILVRGNSLSQIETLPPSFNRRATNPPPTSHGAFELGSTELSDEVNNPILQDAFSITNVAIIDNTLQLADYAAIRMGVGTSGSFAGANAAGSFAMLASSAGPVRQILVAGNVLNDVHASSVVEVHSGLQSTAIACTNNTLNGTAWVSQCATSIPAVAVAPTVTGASLQCKSDGTFQAVGPLPPSHFLAD